VGIPNATKISNGLDLRGGSRLSIASQGHAQREDREKQPFHNQTQPVFVPTVPVNVYLVPVSVSV
jgi:hypothetical protein